MLRKSIATAVKFGTVAFLLSTLLFAGGSLGTSSGLVGSMIREITAVSRDAGTQWMLVVCLLVYFVAFTLLERRAKLSRPVSYLKEFGNQWWLVAFVALCLVNYALRYESAAKSLQVLVLVSGIVVGKAVAAWVSFPGTSRVEPSHPRHLLSPPLSSIRSGGEGGRRPGEEASRFIGRNRRHAGILFLLLVFLAGAALVQPEPSVNFYYQGMRRWSGVWDNPNLFGLLMGVGVVLAAGLLAQKLFSEHVAQAFEPAGSGGFPAASFRETGLESPVNPQTGMSALQACHAKLLRIFGASAPRIKIYFFVAAVIVCGIGLFKSYSRGAWLGTASGMGVLLYVLLKYRSSSFSLSSIMPRPALKNSRRVGKPILVLLISLSILAFWQLCSSEWLVARRIASVSNPNDFSWRNRVVAWHGAVQMMRDSPLTGFGWQQAEVTYVKEYCPTRVTESAAIQMNDYLMVGICGGVPALVCFLLYVVSVFRTPRSAPSMSLAGAVVLLVGFWFDGGLFKLPVAVVFWTLLELSQREFSPAPARHSASGFGFSLPRPVAVALTTLSILLAVAAIGISALHLITPQLAISERTLNLARKHLVQAKELKDFEFLAAKPIWAGKPLKTLLQHAELANYNRELINWKFEDEIYRDFVLSPEIDPVFDGELNWRRPLWGNFYPRIRRENDPAAAAEIVVRFLCERVTISDKTLPQQSISEIWERELADAAGCERIYVAALRAAGVPARLNAKRQAELFAGEKWQPAPRPVISSLRVKDL